jgi:hypothetical protein
MGGQFLKVPFEEDGTGAGGYAKEMSAEYKAAEKEMLRVATADADIIIATALIPGRPAPLLIPEDAVYGMKVHWCGRVGLGYGMSLRVVAGTKCPKRTHSGTQGGKPGAIFSTFFYSSLPLPPNASFLFFSFHPLSPPYASHSSLCLGGVGDGGPGCGDGRQHWDHQEGPAVCDQKRRQVHWVRQPPRLREWRVCVLG